MDTGMVLDVDSVAIWFLNVPVHVGWIYGAYRQCSNVGAASLPSLL